MSLHRASTDVCNRPNKQLILFGSTPADADTSSVCTAASWPLDGSRRMPASRTKTWWRGALCPCPTVGHDKRKPRQLCRRVLGHRGKLTKHGDHFDAPAAYPNWPRQNGPVGAKADKGFIRWHKDLLLDKKLWPHGFKGRKVPLDDELDTKSWGRDDGSYFYDSDGNYYGDIHDVTDKVTPVASPVASPVVSPARPPPMPWINGVGFANRKAIDDWLAAYQKFDDEQAGIAFISACYPV